MTTTTIHDLSLGMRRVRPVLPALFLGLVPLGAIFHAEIAAAVQTWIESTAYSHCFFVLPIALYLAWDRRHSLAAVPVVPLPVATLLVLPLAAAWLVAERLGIMEGRQLVALTMLEVLFLAILGWRMAHALMAPLLYLYFLVPFGAFLTPQLQDFTAHFITGGLTFLGIPNASDGNVIAIPEGRFFVAEACAGLRFLIASIAFGALYATLIYRGAWRRAAFIAVSIVLPVIANGVRALGIVVLAHFLGSAKAATADHIIYGWVFFSAVILLLILAGLPFRQDQPEATDGPAPQVPATARAGFPLGRMAQVAVLVVAFAGTGPLAAAAIDRAAPLPASVPLAGFVPPPGCTAAPDGTAAPGVAGLTYRCPGGSLNLHVEVFAPISNPSRVLAALRAASGALASEAPRVTTLVVPGVTPRTWRLVVNQKPALLTASALWVSGQPAGGGLRTRLTMARNSLLGTSRAPVLIALSISGRGEALSPAEANFGHAEITRFLQAQPDLAGQIDRLAALR